MVAETFCRAPANIVGGIRSEGPLTVRSTITYRPQSAYRHVSGNLTRSCGEDELWSGGQPVFEGAFINNTV